MGELPDFTIPNVLLVLEAKDIGRCACIAKVWASWMQWDPVASKVAPTRARAQMTDAEKVQIDQNLIQAAIEGNLDNLQEHLSCGALIEAQNNISWTPLIAAARKGHLSVVQKLIGQGADVNATNSFNNTALNLAAYHGHAAVVQALITSGASLDLQNNLGKTALDNASERRCVQTAQMLRAAGGQE